MSKKPVLLTVLAMLFCLVLVLPAFGAENSALIQASDLKQLAGSDSVIIIDIRGTEAYETGHVPGAIAVDMSEFYENRDGVTKLAAGAEKFSALLSSIGFSGDKQVIIYGAGKDSPGNDLKYATRAWWVFHMYGCENVRVLDGGIDSWTALGYELSTETAIPSETEYTVTESNVQQDTVATVEEVKAALDTNTVIVDCRNTDYFQGKVAKSARAGHITGAILIPASELLNDDTTFKSAAELAKVFAGYGITETIPVITYCNTGTTATIHYFALTQILGYTDVQNFDASLMGWALDPTLPMESNYDFFTVDSPVGIVNTVQQHLPAAPFIEDGTFYLDAEVLADCLGAEVEASNEDVTTLTLGDNIFRTMKPIVKDGSIFVPVRKAADALGATVEWDGEKKQLSVFLP